MGFRAQGGEWERATAKSDSAGAYSICFFMNRSTCPGLSTPSPAPTVRHESAAAAEAKRSRSTSASYRPRAQRNAPQKQSPAPDRCGYEVERSVDNTFFLRQVD